MDDLNVILNRTKATKKEIVTRKQCGYKKRNRIRFTLIVTRPQDKWRWRG